MGKFKACPPLKKMGRGVSNIVGSPLEIPATFGEHRRATNDSVANCVVGSVLGVGNGVKRLAVGAYEVVTFFAPERDQILPTLRYFHVDRNRKT
jgi:putative exosortase-associated protein (TIGR04073 family)